MISCRRNRCNGIVWKDCVKIDVLLLLIMSLWLLVLLLAVVVGVVACYCCCVDFAELLIITSRRF